jgi:hypothetical protein
MGFPAVDASIRRRILVNFRVRESAVAALLPQPFSPRLVNSWAMVGICLIRLEQVRPHGFPAALGLPAENAAHRIAVEWSDGGGQRQGVYIPFRDTNSAFVNTLGGRLFPGVYRSARFWVGQGPADSISIEMRSSDGLTDCLLRGRIVDQLNTGSVFSSLEQASRFFQVGTLGYSPRARCDEVDGLELESTRWRAQSFAVDELQSRFFGDSRRFPPGSIEFDSALIVRNLPCRWHSRGYRPIEWRADPESVGPTKRPSATS